MSAGERSRSRAAAEQALVAAAAELLGEVGPRAITVRDIAAQAGVNHGLVHHYFGGKDGLLREAMKRLVHEHHEFAAQQRLGGILPAPLGLIGDQRYLRAVARCVLDGEMGLARTELDEGVSVPNQTLATLTAMQHLDEPTLAMKVEKYSVASGLGFLSGWYCKQGGGGAGGERGQAQRQQQQQKQQWEPGHARSRAGVQAGRQAGKQAGRAGMITWSESLR